MSARPRWHWPPPLEAVPGEGNVVFLVPVVPKRAPKLIRLALETRRAAIIDGRCPCGATFDRKDRTHHTADCPATDGNVDRLLAQYGRSA